MFFTKIGTLLAYLGFFLGILGTAVGFAIALGASDMESNAFFAKRYFAASNSGDVIDKGITYIGVSVVLGILCEISRSRAAAVSA